jgi:hypothetical protein
VLEDQFTGDDVGANRTRDKIPSMARRQDGSARAAQMEEGIGEIGGDEVANNVSLSASRRKPHFAYVVIGWGLT